MSCELFLLNFIVESALNQPLTCFVSDRGDVCPAEIIQSVTMRSLEGTRNNSGNAVGSLNTTRKGRLELEVRGRSSRR
jgi:hypothetical protein